MMTNVIAYLHTTFAYQSAAMQLMVGQANFDAQQLHLRETLPITAPANTNAWIVAAPPDGVAGGFATSNYIYRFLAGKLAAIYWKPHPRGTAADAAETQASLIDTNGAYELARQWLSGLSVDVTALESKYPHHVADLAARPPIARRPVLGATNRAPGRAVAAARRASITPPVFRVTWGGRSGRAAAASTPVQVTVEVLGSTKQCIGLRVQNPDLLKAPPLQLTNQDKLLGTPPPPQHFVEEFFGGPAAYGIVARPDRVAAWLVLSRADQMDSKSEDCGGCAAEFLGMTDQPDRINRTPAVAVDVNTAALLSRTLTDFNSYSWLGENGCRPDYQARLLFTKGADTVQFLLSFECDHLLVSHNGRVAEKDCDGAHAALVGAIKAIFPHDGVIKNLSLSPSQPQ